MPYVSEAYKVADAVKTVLSNQVWGDPYTAWLATVEETKRYSVKQLPLIGRDQRTAIGRLRFFVTPQTRAVGAKDRCGLRWDYGVVVGIVGACVTQDTVDKTQPVGLAELDEYMGLTERVADFLYDQKTIGGRTRVGEPIVNLLKDDAMRQAQIYIGAIAIEFR